MRVVVRVHAIAAELNAGHHLLLASGDNTGARDTAGGRGGGRVYA